MRQLFKDAEHLFRMAGLFVLGTSSIFVLRAFLVPPDFGLYGHYRAGAIADNAARPLIHAGRATCETCHETVAAARAGGKHERIGCESCHGALGDHAADPVTTTPALPRTGKLCVNCHERSAARPAWFPQIEPEEHSGGEPCEQCHDPHHPDFD